MGGMHRTPPFLVPYLSKTYASLSIQEIQFSGSTYQIHVADPQVEEEVWSFCQLGPQEELVDAFCSCRETEQNEGCQHLALAYQTIFGKSGIPLHRLYHQSLFYVLGKIWFHRYAGKMKGTGFKAEAFSEQGAHILDLIGGKKIPETEENSIKFSNLTEEELEEWHQGRPSEALSFELSGWSDLVKQLFLFHQNKPLQILFEESANGLPSAIILSSDDFRIKSRLDESDILKIIPVLNSVEASLTVFNRLKDRLEKIQYDQKQESLTLFAKDGHMKHKGLAVGDWNYVKGLGFYPESLFVEKRQVLKDEEIKEFLNQYGAEAFDLLKNETFHAEPTDLHYFLEFDSKWNLLIQPYILHPHDLQQKGVKRWGQWLYFPLKGFYNLQEPILPIPSRIEGSAIEDFISKNRDWLNQQPGFQIHSGGLKNKITYEVDEMGSLHFHQKRLQAEGRSRDFGIWVYIEGEGFFNKSHKTHSDPFDLAFPIRKDLVPSFIEHHRRDLALIPGFFREERLFEDVGLEISLDKSHKIWIEPRYLFHPKWNKLPHRFYEKWVYVEHEGFFEIPLSERLPEKVQEIVGIPKDEVRHFLEYELGYLEPWIRKIDSRLLAPLSIRLILDHIEETKDHRWKIALHYQTEKGEIPLHVIAKALEKKEKFLFLKEGRLDLSHERFQWLKRLKIVKEPLILSTIELIRLHALEEVGTKGASSQLFNEVMQLKRVPPFQPHGLKSILRPYQKNGAEWLFSLYNYLLGGLLCDEMGLGKTHQAMALMAAVITMKPTAKFLVVCPTSVLYHWQDKLQEFFPSLKAWIYHGTAREQKFPEECSLFLTSYGILRGDIGWIQKQFFDIAVFDEIQVAKNHRSKLYQALQRITAEVRIGLTGTPLENRLRELKALFDIVLPGYMPSEADYNRLIVRPIERMRDMQKKGLIQRLTQPFVLRRKKWDVLKDLPEKVEAVMHCTLSDEQDRLYRETLLIQRNELLEDIVDMKKAVPYLHVFSLLSRLKQICNHPALYLKVPEAYHKHHSGKWELFIELLQEARESQQKVVVYSQYLGMLDIIENYLKDHGIGFASLRGSTRDRKEQLRLFAEDPACEVFVASLKAAGLGIDLTSASVVIHYDRWWNAARENQATDRVHRFGQSRGVQVFKLVSKHTFEERIDQIIERKKGLLDDAIAFDDHEVMKSFTREELFELLQYLPSKA